jgi:hypothetical protein
MTTWAHRGNQRRTSLVTSATRPGGHHCKPTRPGGRERSRMRRLPHPHNMHITALIASRYDAHARGYATCEATEHGAHSSSPTPRAWGIGYFADGSTTTEAFSSRTAIAALGRIVLVQILDCIRQPRVRRTQRSCRTTATRQSRDRGLRGAARRIACGALCSPSTS